MSFSSPDVIGSSPQSVFEVRTGSSKQEHAVGTVMRLGGRTFRYASMFDTTAIGPNKLAQMCPPVAAHVSETGALTGTATVGATRVTATLGATAAYAGEYKDGYLYIESATTGAGQMFKLRDHAAVASSGVLTADLYDPVITATSGTTTWSLVHEAWASVVIQPTTITAPAAGVTLVNWPAATSTAPNFGWLQTGGLCSVLNGTTDLVAGSGVTPWGATTAGAIAVAVETNILQRIGVSTQTITTNDTYVVVHLQID